MISIRSVSGSSEALLEQLAALLIDSVGNGASVGFLAPVAPETARRYWSEVFSALGPGLVLWVAEADGHVVGSVQLSRCRKENGLHRAEVQKLLVRSDQRRKGIASLLMNELETFARADGKILLVLDTETGSGAERLYQGLGFTRLGDIPNYALTSDGQLCSTTYYFKQL